MFSRRYFLIFFFFLILGNISAQKSQIRKWDYKEIEKKIDSLHNEPEKMWELINLYIQKSKKENNYETLLYAYRYASNYSEYPKNLKFADSALMVGKKSADKKLLTDAYLNRGIAYMKQFLYNNALDDILVANTYSTDVGDEYNIYKTIYYIAQNKKYLGLYEDANKELEVCLKYFKKNLNKKDLGKNYEMYYLYSLMSYIDSNIRLGKTDQNKPLFEEAFNYCEKQNLKQYIPYFISLMGTGAYYSKDYKTAIIKLTEALESYNDQWPHLTEVFYLGQTYWKTGKRGLAIKYLEEVDNEYNKTKNLGPEFRSAYEILIKYNDSIGNKNKQLEYINKLMELDRSYEKNYKYLYPKINKEYDTQKLLEEKENIEKSMEVQKQVLLGTIIISILIILFNVLRYYRLKKMYRKRFNEIIEELNEKENQKVSSVKMTFLQSDKTGFRKETDMEYYNKIPGMNPFFVQNVLKQLDKFEEENQFLNPQISQKALSEAVGTNSTYFSKIINTYKGKKFGAYISDLRLDYIIHQLRTDLVFLNTDIKELARISGYASAESFSVNFQKKFNIKPSYFIKMMKEEKFKASFQSAPESEDDDDILI